MSPNNSDTQRKDDNRYAPPESGYAAIKHNVQPSTWTYIWITFLCIWNGLFIISFSQTIKKFTELFKGFGSDLPAITSFVVSNVGVLAGMLIFIFLVQLGFYIRFLLAKNAISRRVVAWCGFANIVFQFIAIYAMYAPIFKLGTVV
jgi:hypothetical protein